MMKCPVCASELSGQETACPRCHTSAFLQSGFLHVAASDDSPGQKQRPAIIFQILFALTLAAAIFSLTLIVRLNFFGNRLTNPVVSPVVASKPSPSPVIVAPIPASPVFSESPALAPVLNESQVELAEKSRNNAERAITPSAPTSMSLKPATIAHRITLPVSSAPPVPVPAPVPSPVPAPAITPPVAPSTTSPATENEPAPALTVEPPDQTLTKNTGLITIHSYAKARIYIDGQYSGTTPRTVRLLAGSHTITLLADGYEEWSRTIRLAGKQQTGLMASMNKK